MSNEPIGGARQKAAWGKIWNVILSDTDDEHKATAKASEEENQTIHAVKSTGRDVKQDSCMAAAAAGDTMAHRIVQKCMELYKHVSLLRDPKKYQAYIQSQLQAVTDNRIAFEAETKGNKGG